MSRYDRQQQLAEVGALGQALLGRVALLTPAECSAEEAHFARLYAERCGMMVEKELGAAVPATLGSHQTVRYPTNVAMHFNHQRSAAIGIGAAVALSHVVTALLDQPRGMERTHT